LLCPLIIIRNVYTLIRIAVAVSGIVHLKWMAAFHASTASGSIVPTTIIASHKTIVLSSVIG
jgi:hypothetical protein